MKSIINILICIFILNSNALAQKNSLTFAPSEIQRLIGCWNDSESKEWRYGFFEKFAVYDNDFWEYQSINFQKNKAEIVLKKGEDIMKLKLTFDSKSDSICMISTPTQKDKQKYIRYSSAPNFTNEDHSTFIDNGYKDDSITVIGYISNGPKNTPIEITVPNFFNEDDDTYTIKVDSTGCFRCIIPITNTTFFTLDSENSKLSINAIAEPRDIVLLFYDSINKDTRIMGQNGRLNQELINYEKEPSTNVLHGLSMNFNEKMTHDTFLLEQQKIYDKRNKILEEYISRHPLLSDKFKSYKRNQERTEHAKNLMKRRYELRLNFNKEHFNKKYMEYVDNLYKQISQPYTLYGVSFLAEYYTYYNNFLCPNWMTSEIEILRYTDRKKEYELTTQQKADLSAYDQYLSNKVMGNDYNKDSLEIASVIQPYKEAYERTVQLLQKNEIKELCKKYQSNGYEIAEAGRMQNEFLYFDSITVPPVLKELMVTNIFNKHLNRTQAAFKELAIHYFKSIVSNESLRKKVLKQQEKFVLLANQELKDIENLKKNDEWKDIKDAGELLKQLIAPYKGKVIYMDFWGTWCSPCKEEMKFVPAVKEELNGKDIIFMYLANTSPEESWKNIIKKNHLTGSNVVHYNLPEEQQKILEKHLDISFFPTFMLFDKKGNIAEKHAPSPSEKDLLIHRINELLAK